MKTSKTSGQTGGDARQPGRARLSRWLTGAAARWPGRVWLSRWRQRLARSADGSGRLAGLTVRAARRAPGAPGGWSRFLAAHMLWILLGTLVTVGGAAE